MTLIEGITAVMLTEVMPNKKGNLEKRVLESEEPKQSPDILSPMGKRKWHKKGPGRLVIKS